MFEPRWRRPLGRMAPERRVGVAGGQARRPRDLDDGTSAVSPEPEIRQGRTRPNAPHQTRRREDRRMSPSSLRMSELVATLALGQDNAFGQPLESQLRSCLLAVWLSDEADLGPDTRSTVYWTALLRYVGCTGHAHEVSGLFGDEIVARARTLLHDAANPQEVIGEAIALATAGHPPDEQEQIRQIIEREAIPWSEHNFASGCEVADVLVRRLGFGPDVRDALRCTFERWNGMGFPAHVSGEDIPLPMRIVHLTHDMEAIGRLGSFDEALEAAHDRRDRTYDPRLVDLFVAHGEHWFGQLGKVEPWDATLELEPSPRRELRGTDLDDALRVVADFVDLKSPFMGGHSRRCAALCSRAAAVAGLTDDEATALVRAALVHDLGSTAIPNSIWDKPGPLTRAEFDRVEIHPMLTEQMLRRSPALAELTPLAASHHERLDGSGYHRRERASADDVSSGILAAADVYTAMTSDRADRPAYSEVQAAAELALLVSGGVLDGRATDAVLSASGHGSNRSSRRASTRPGGLTKREVEVLRLAARGLTTAAIAEELFISPKTVDHHVQHVYTKIGVSTRAAAALWAMEHGVVA